MDMGLPRSVALQPVIYDVRQGVLAGQVEVEGFRASARAEDGAHAAAPYKAAAPNPSAQWPLAVLAAAHVAACGRGDEPGCPSMPVCQLPSVEVGVCEARRPLPLSQSGRCVITSVSKH